MGARVWRRGASRCYIGEEEANGCGIGLPMATLDKPADAGMAPLPRLTNGRARRYGEGGGDADEWVQARKRDKTMGSTSKIKTKIFPRSKNHQICIGQR